MERIPMRISLGGGKDGYRRPVVDGMWMFSFLAVVLHCFNVESKQAGEEP